jgi:hypothetical protein
MYGQEPKNCYLLELTGTQRYIWGPFTWERAVLEKGRTCQIVRGTGLRDATAMTPGAVQAAFQSGRIWPIRNRAEAVHHASV